MERTRVLPIPFRGGTASRRPRHSAAALCSFNDNTPFRKKQAPPFPRGVRRRMLKEPPCRRRAGPSPLSEIKGDKRQNLWYNNRTKAGTLDLSGVPAFLVTNVLQVQY